MTNKEFYGAKLLAIAIWSKNKCQLLHELVFGKSCQGKNCFNCEFSTVGRIKNWLNTEHKEPPLLENGDSLNPGDWIMVRDCDGERWGKRQFLFYYNDRFYCQLVDRSIGNGEYVSWKQARLQEDGE